VAVVSPCDLSVCTEPVVLKRPSRCEVMEGSEARGTCTTCRRRPRARTGCVLVTPPTFLRHHFSGDTVRQRLKARPHTPHRIFGAGATANWITKGAARNRAGPSPGPSPGPTPAPAGTQEKSIDCRFSSRDSRLSCRGAMAVGTPCTRGAPSRKPRALYTRHAVLAYKPTTAQYPV
jgi:hypothetical protein